MAEQKRGDALQFIFSLFIGVLIVVVVGVGVWTFYPPPDSENSPQQQKLQELYRQQELGNIGTKSPDGSLDATQQAKAEKIQVQINTLQREMDKLRKPWAVNTSIMVLSIATILMAISLLLPESWKVFSNGILLGGLFSVIYATGVSFAGGNSQARFWVSLAALILALVFGYLRFVRGKREAAVASKGAPAVALAPDSAEVAGLLARIDALEARQRAAADALRSED